MQNGLCKLYVTYSKQRAAPLNWLKEIVPTVEEFEALRLKEIYASSQQSVPSLPSLEKSKLN